MYTVFSKVNIELNQVHIDQVEMFKYVGVEGNMG